MIILQIDLGAAHVHDEFLVAHPDADASLVVVILDICDRAFVKPSAQDAGRVDDAVWGDLDVRPLRHSLVRHSVGTPFASQRIWIRPLTLQFGQILARCSPQTP